jgi:hypothetical protein
MNDGNLRTLIRLIPPARALRDSVEKNIEMELYSGTGAMAVQTYGGLWTNVAALDDSPYVASLALEIHDGIGEQEKASLVLLAANQLLAYLEGQTGLVGLGEGGGNRSYNSPNTSINNIKGLPSGTVDSMLDIAAGGKKKKEKEAAKDGE